MTITVIDTSVDLEQLAEDLRAIVQAEPPAGTSSDQLIRIRAFVQDLDNARIDAAERGLFEAAANVALAGVNGRDTRTATLSGFRDGWVNARRAAGLRTQYQLSSETGMVEEG